MLEDKAKFCDGDHAQAIKWLGEPPNPQFRSICNVIKELDQLDSKNRLLCMEAIWMAKKIANKLTEYRNASRSAPA